MPTFVSCTLIAVNMTARKAGGSKCATFSRRRLGTRPRGQSGSSKSSILRNSVGWLSD
jgi:hypothetical protein